MDCIVDMLISWGNKSDKPGVLAFAGWACWRRACVCGSTGMCTTLDLLELLIDPEAAAFTGW